MCFCPLLSEEAGSVPLNLGLSNCNLSELTLQFWKTEKSLDTRFTNELNAFRLTTLFLFRCMLIGHLLEKF